MTAYKFLSSGAIGLFSRHAWPAPTAGSPGEWVRIEGEIQPCLNGIHACTREQLVEWLDDELWEIELDGAVLEADGELIAPAGRLLSRHERWNDDSAREFAAHCVDSTVELAAEALIRTGRTVEADALAASRSRPSAELEVLQLARTLEDDPTSPVLFMADLIRLERGGRPELEADVPTGDAGGPAPAALAANLAYVCAHITAQLAEQATIGTYNETFARERISQSVWFAEQLDLD